MKEPKTRKANEKKEDRKHQVDQDSKESPVLNNIRIKLLGRRKSALVTLGKGLLPVGVLLDDESAGGISTKTSAALQRQLGRKLEAAGALDGLDGDLEVGNRLLVVDGRVGEHKRAKGDVAAGLAVFRKDDLVEVRGHRDRRRAANHLVLDVPLVVDGVFAREVQRAGHDADGRVAHRQTAAEIFEMCPVVAVEALADLRAHVGQVKRLVHGLLRPLGVGGRHLVSAVVPAAVVVLEPRAEFRRHTVIFEKVAVLAVGVAARERGRRDVLDDPVRVARAAVVRGDEGGPRGDVGDGTGEAVLEQAGRVDGGVGGGHAGGERRADGKGRGLRDGVGTGEGGCGLKLLLLLLLIGFGAERVDGSCQGSTASGTKSGDHGERLFGHGEEALAAVAAGRLFIRFETVGRALESSARLCCQWVE